MSRATRLINSLFRALTRLGLGASYRHILTVPGRKTGRLYSTPVDVLELASGGLSPAMGRQAGSRTPAPRARSHSAAAVATSGYGVEETAPTAAVAVLRKNITEIRVTRPYFDAGPSSPDEEIAAELPRHPVFHLAPR